MTSNGRSDADSYLGFRLAVAPTVDINASSRHMLPDAQGFSVVTPVAILSSSDNASIADCTPKHYQPWALMCCRDLFVGARALESLRNGMGVQCAGNNVKPARTFEEGYTVVLPGGRAS